ncbi:hypothetical protein K9M47_04295 [Candidatus Gracilibacteria bacterium]|nr:hypothetical protein [Candidatus Gracilibacteria bacterium]MCF7898647.1 hypothetical protein [Candidatus Paceibacterota bacterium]
MIEKSWWENAVFYELYVDKFSGNFQELSKKIDYFQKLGINCLHILPPFPSPMVDDGYDISDYLNIREDLGTLEDFKKFIEDAHKNGIKIMIDLVLNHVSEKHPWFINARSSKNSTYRNYFIWSDTGEELKDATNVFFHLKPNNWIKNEQTNDFYFTTFYAEQPDLNWDEPKILKEVTNAMDYWIELGIDAFRLDAAPHLVKKEGSNSVSLPETHIILKKLRFHLEIKNRKNIALLAEVNDTPEKTLEYFGQGDECHLVYHFPLTSKILLAAKNDTPHIIDELRISMTNVPKGCQWVTFLRNHDALIMPSLTLDEKKGMLEYGDPTSAYHFRINHGMSVRLATFFEKNPEKIKDAYRMLFSMPGSPVIYYGEEIGMKNDTTIDEQKDTRRYVRGVFNWTEATNQTNNTDSLFSFISNELKAKNRKI